MRKLTESDKQEILKLYRETAETTSTLAERYGVSNSTISRLLKSTLPEEDYEYLVSLKRAARTPEGRAQVSYEQLPLLSQPAIETAPVSSEKPRLELLHIEPDKPVIEAEVSNSESIPPPIPAIRRVKTRSSATEKPITEKPKLPTVKEIEIVRHRPTELPSIPRTILEDEEPEVNVIAGMFDDDLLDESDDLDDLDDDLYEDEEDFEDEDFEEAKPLVTRRRPGEGAVQVLPLSVAPLPKTCYLVIDRSAELITRPLKDFGDLGQIPTIETQQRTLPVFDNHRVAKRFSTKRDRVIKVPDSRMLHKASTHLQAKGITRLLIDGQVYSLSLV
ncbi:transposase [Sphaerospermopsis aphanizomenoides BCCUSP55]|uniref:helix-turn-helix domain-containing protein n=1 Tax=Sphaerospermopsis aphanizomenoides TaxID=459663 RepID=UPI000ABA61AF|nr:transposase [Sphaerospermopsis aphanizomenoides]MBK1987852.1 transposase [Sphaerospermopsis aphanizomenoides BCCUSP55]